MFFSALVPSCATPHYTGPSWCFPLVYNLFLYIGVDFASDLLQFSEVITSCVLCNADSTKETKAYLSCACKRRRSRIFAHELSYYLIKYQSIITTIYNHGAKKINEGTVVFIYATKVYRRSRGVAPLIHNLGARAVGPAHICHIYELKCQFRLTL